MPEWKRFIWERQKFKDLILYFSQRGIDDGLVIGSTKLNKLLFFTDFRAYAELGKPVTGARYKRLEHGPVAIAMLPIRSEMIEEGEIHFQDRPVDDLSDVLVPDVLANLDAFSEDELRIADEVFEELRPYNARGVSDLSHEKSAGWIVMDDDEIIPYESAFVSTEPASPEAVARGQERLDKRSTRV